LSFIRQGISVLLCSKRQKNEAGWCWATRLPGGCFATFTIRSVTPPIFLHMRRTIHIVALKFLSTVYLQLFAACLLVSIGFPAASWGPLAVDKMPGMPGAEQRTVLVQYRHIPLTAPLTVPDSPCLLSPGPKPSVLQGWIVAVQEVPAGFRSWRSSLLTNKAPPPL
jgi:hypothetical protein